MRNWLTPYVAINRGQQNGFSIIGVEPTIQWRFGDTNFVAAAGCHFTVAGLNSIGAIYPNLSIFHYWSQTGKVLMR